MSIPYISRRLKIDSTRVFACIPREGTYAATLTNNVYFPWTFDRKDLDHGVPWHMRVKQFELSMSVSGTYDNAGTPTAFSYTITTEVMERENILFGDLRDRQIPGETPWGYFDTTGPDTSSTRLGLFFKAGPSTGTGAIPFTAYQTNATDIMPAFFFESGVSLGGIGNIALYSHPLVGFVIKGSGTLDGNSFDLYSDAVDGVLFLSLTASATITKLTEYTF